MKEVKLLYKISGAAILPVLYLLIEIITSDLNTPLNNTSGEMQALKN